MDGIGSIQMALISHRSSIDRSESVATVSPGITPAVPMLRSQIICLRVIALLLQNSFPSPSSFPFCFRASHSYISACYLNPTLTRTTLQVARWLPSGRSPPKHDSSVNRSTSQIYHHCIHNSDCVLFYGYWPRRQLHVFQILVHAMVDNQGTCGCFRCQTDERDAIRVDFSFQEQAVTLLWKCNPTSLFFPSPQSQRYVGDAGS
ncbi:hypothetical protein CY34DRAFT_318826 [Suillus luteus UH-Slu-Lm8-n1]|uniref:Unplaced genomic scaffold CY34scaffold_20, whole genome shotgun sequence n=1 Tax=Suillus luteus UH-Slu-Lm8-n1 TaxID=930992 RepID=A0A0D0AA33_9AGAM|nr:hypothetical protein CY34DRAFT_318826 [Suillus luteus UH-Slu-Lm8-n1]